MHFFLHVLGARAMCAVIDVPQTSTRQGSALLVLLCGISIPLLYLGIASYGTDFRAFYVASQALSHHLDPYLNHYQLGPRFDDPASHANTSRWLYPPTALFAVMPFAALSYVPARAIFAVLSFASLAWVSFYLAKRFSVPRPWILLACISLPVIACMQRGQVDLLVLFLLVLTFALGNRLSASIPLALAICLKVFPAALLLWLLLRRRYRQAAVTMSCVLTVAALSLWRFGLAAFSACVRNLAVIVPADAQDGPVDLHRFGIPSINWKWFSLSQGFIGSYNNPLVLLGKWGVPAGCLLIIAAAFLLHRIRVVHEIGYFSMVLVAQLMNTRLWTMGTAMYIPVCLICIARSRSIVMSALLMVPLYLPSQLRIYGINPRYSLAITLVVVAIRRSSIVKDQDSRVLPPSEYLQQSQAT